MCTKPAGKQQGRGTAGSAVNTAGHGDNQGRTEPWESHLRSFFQPAALPLRSPCRDRCKSQLRDHPANGAGKTCPGKDDTHHPLCFPPGPTTAALQPHLVRDEQTLFCSHTERSRGLGITRGDCGKGCWGLRVLLQEQ